MFRISRRHRYAAQQAFLLATYVPRRATALGVRYGAGRLVKLPDVSSVPEGRMVDLPGRGRLFVADVAGPTPDAPTVVLLHGLATTAYLSWFTALGSLSQHYRVVTFDLRWHGRGLRGDSFRVADCADDVAAVLDHLDIDRAVLAGYSLGGAVAQETWHRHPERVAGLVLCSTAGSWAVERHEKLFFPVLGAVMVPLARLAVAAVERRASSLPDLPSFDTTNLAAWGLAELRSTSGWTTPHVVSELGRFDSSPWIGGVDVPTAVVVTEKDGAIPAARQRALAASIPGAIELTSPGGHASLFFDHERWGEIFLDAVAQVTERLPRSGQLAG
ncbi:hypothetical protein BH09ACT12_BH09ACT12_19870 [soil metagenome]